MGTIQASFTTLDLLPMDYRFLNKFSTEDTMLRDKMRTMTVHLDQRKCSSVGVTMPNFQTDASTLQEITNVMQQRLGLRLLRASL